MARVHVFADEAGNFDFSRKRGASRFFILSTVVFPNGHEPVAAALRALRFELAWEGVDLVREFHATEDRQQVRDRVFEVLRDHDFRIDVTILEKPKAREGIRRSEEQFYQTAWFFHLHNVLPELVKADDELHVVAASLGTKSKRASFRTAIESAVREVSPAGARTAFWPAAADLCLQVADYCAWALQRKWELGDSRSYEIIKDRIVREHDLFHEGESHFTRHVEGQLSGSRRKSPGALVAGHI